MFELWCADLNSLYNLKPRSEILIGTYPTLSEARKAKNAHVNHVTAGWIVRRDSETALPLPCCTAVVGCEANVCASGIT